MAELSKALPNAWYVAKTRPNSETKALFHLERQGFEVYLPQLLRRIKHARKTTWQPRPLFPTYLFVRMSAAQQRWRAINSTVGVSHLICNRQGPLPVPAAIVDDIKEHEDSRGLILTGGESSFRKGARVEVMSGAFAEHLGRFVNATDDECGVILLDLMGRQVTAKVRLDSITAPA